MANKMPILVGKFWYLLFLGAFYSSDANFIWIREKTRLSGLLTVCLKVLLFVTLSRLLYFVLFF
jgi:hypothetical protein